MRRRLLLFFGGALAFWLLAALPVRMAWGDTAVTYSGTALALCLLPAVLTLLWSGWAFRQSPEQQLVMVLGGTGVRIFMVLLGATLVYASVPYFQQEPGFWLWVLVFYLFTLALEMVVMLAGRPAPGGS